MTRLIVVRHGNSLGNRDRIFIGQTDWGLSELGEAQVVRTTEYLDRFQIDEVYSSDLSRAYNTVLPSAEKRGLYVHKRKGLREIHAGEWETKKFEDLPVLFEKSFGLWMTDIGKTRCEGGESLAELYKRVKATMKRIIRENEGKTVLVGTHATVLRVMNCIWHNDKVENLQKYDWSSNAAVSIVECYPDGTYKIIDYGYDGHLEGMVTPVPCK